MSSYVSFIPLCHAINERVGQVLCPNYMTRTLKQTMGKSVNICQCHVSLGFLFFLPETAVPQDLSNFHMY